jgi:glyoxylase-like metal-dependent hydrolase (beta-lactamase superfamily II)
MTQAIPIEDFCEDIVGKAMRGLGLSDSDVASRCNASESQIQAIRRGESTEPTVLRAIAPVLNLDADALVVSAEKSWYPEPIEVDGLALFNTPYHAMDMLVNAFVVRDPQSQQAAIFDSGADAAPLIEYIENHDLDITALFLTHTHPDHVADVDTILARFPGIPVYSNQQEPWPCPGAEHFEEGTRYSIGALSVDTRTTWGHAKGGTTFVVEGLSRTLAIVGDALFAGSMGGPKLSLAVALRTNREHIFSLPDETVICPGHGPLTTVGEEKAHNPFFPEFK